MTWRPNWPTINFRGLPVAPAYNGDPANLPPDLSMARCWCGQKDDLHPTVDGFICTRCAGGSR